MLTDTSTPQRRGKAITFLTAAIAIGLTMTAPAQADPPKTSHVSNSDASVTPSGGWSEDVLSYIDDDNDKGGYGARLVIRHPDSPYASAYDARFYPRGEKLGLEDGWTDERKAVADVKVYNKRGDLVDRDHLTIGTKKTFNLGTPDGTGNIPEGYGVDVRLCAGSTYCTDWADGVA